MKHLIKFCVFLFPLIAVPCVDAQIPMKDVLSRITVPSEGGLRGLVDIVGFPRTAAQMDAVGKLCEKLEQDAVLRNQKRFGLDDATKLVCGVCPHDDYILASRVYVHVQRYMKAKTVILVGNAHWSEAFGIRDKLIFGDFRQWRGPYGPVTVSPMRDEIVSKLPSGDYTVNRKLAETEHSLEGVLPFLQYFNRKVEIVPILIPFSHWDTIDRLGGELARAVSGIMKEKGWKLGEDVAVLCSTDGQHYGDYGWSYYNYHPFGCDADGYKKALEFDTRAIGDHLAGKADTARVRSLFEMLVDQNDISNYKVTWCGRFAMPFGVDFAIHLARAAENRTLDGFLLRQGSSLSEPWLPIKKYGLGLTSDANLHHFVTYFAIGYR